MTGPVPREVSCRAFEGRVSHDLRDTVCGWCFVSFRVSHLRTGGLDLPHPLPFRCGRTWFSEVRVDDRVPTTVSTCLETIHAHRSGGWRTGTVVYFPGRCRLHP